MPVKHTDLSFLSLLGVLAPEGGYSNHSRKAFGGGTDHPVEVGSL